MKKTLVVSICLIVCLYGLFVISPEATGHPLEKPLVVWYTVAKHLDSDFLDAVEKYKPDIVLLTVYAEDDIRPVNGTDFDYRKIVEDIHSRGSEVYFSFSLFSRSAVPREIYDQRLAEGIPYSEQDIHMSDYSRYLRENDLELYHQWYDYWLEKGMDPEDIPHVERRPVDGYYIPPGHYTAINPLYKPYREFMAKAIEEIIEKARPDGLAFDHVRFFTFDEGYNQDIGDWLLERYGLDIYNYTPKPMFQLDIQGWSEEDHLYYDGRAKLIEEVVGDITGRFNFTKFGTTIGMTEPARANGQYVELQANLFDALLLMAYDEDRNEIFRNVNETREACNCDVILGIYPFEDQNTAMQNIDAGLEAGAKGVYLLGYKFSEEVHQHLLEARGLE